MFRILLATDFTEASVNAYRYCMSLSDLGRMQVLVAHVYSHGAHPHLSSANLELFYRKEYNAFLTRTKRFSQLYPNLVDPQMVMRSAIKVEVSEGRTSSELIEIGQEHDVDIILIGSKTRPGIFRRLFGDLSRSLLYDTTIPLLIVPQSYTGASPQKAAMLSITSDDEERMSGWLNDMKSLRDIEHVYWIVPYGAQKYVEAEPGRAHHAHRYMTSTGFAEIHAQLKESAPDMVIVTLRGSDNDPAEAYRNELVHYLYDHLKVPLVCLMH